MRRVWAVLVGLGLCGAAVADAFLPLSLEKVANASRQDERAADDKGGWLDLGSNDLRVLPAGRANYAGVPFEVPPCADENAQVCLVLGRGQAKKASLDIGGRCGERLYLLHAVAGGLAPEMRDWIGTVKVKYEDGSKVERHVRMGRDVGDWTCGRAFDNAARAWTAYNNHTQVSLFVSSVVLDLRKPVVKISFEATGKCPWMVLAATLGTEINLKGLRSKLDLAEKFQAPPPRAKRLVRGPAGARPKNVILLIGDGMGPGAVRFTSLYQHGRNGALQMQQMPVAGLCLTQSADRDVTDSAAAGTAFATGTKTSNGVLGLGIASKAERKNPRQLVSTAEKAHRAGLAVALLTNDKLTGATPAAFYAHVAGRGDTAQVAEQAATSGFEVLVGSSGSRRGFFPVAKGGDRKDGLDVIEAMAKGGYVCVTSQQAFAAAPAGSKIVGFFLDEPQSEASVAAALKTALARVGDSPKGFFMMCESALPDHGNHGNNPAKTVKGTLQVDWAAAAALDFAEARGDTLVIVTADHETGGVSAVRSPDGGKATIHYSATSHTGLPVALFAYGPGAECFEGLIDNTDIAKILQRLLGL